MGTGTANAVDYVEYIVDYQHAPDVAALDALAAALGAEVVETTTHWDYRLWRLDEPVTAEILASMDMAGAVLDYVSPNLTVTTEGVVEDTVSAEAALSDPQGWRQWGLENTGQTGGTVDADIDATEAWDRSTGAGVTVAVIDTGVDLDHPDLVANLWTNPGEIAGNGIDDDGNGFIDDVYGWDFANHDATPDDDHGHGTHVAGTIAAAAGNGTGVAGVAPGARVMALKFLGANGSGSTFDALQALDYAVMMGVQVSNNSWGGASYSSSFARALQDAAAAGHIFVSSAGNNAANTDLNPYYPASYDGSNVITVAATDQYDMLASYSNYGFTTVDVAAPGSLIYSAYRGGGYATMSGTSMAAPHVSGTVALLLAMEPWLTPAEVRARLIETSDPVAWLAAKTASSGRVNASQALGPEPTAVLSGRLVDEDGLGMAYWRVGIDLDGDGRLGTGEPATLTTDAGIWRLEGLRPGSYTVLAEIAPGWAPAGTVPGTYRAVTPGDAGTATATRTDLTGWGTRHDLGDEGVAEIALPEGFTFWGQRFDRVWISANGLLSFTEPGDTWNASGLGAAPAFSVAAYWADLSTAHGGAIWTAFDSSGALVVHWAEVRGTDGRGIADMVVTLLPDGDIRIAWTAVPDTRPGVVGLRGADASQTVALDAAALPAAITFTTRPGTMVRTAVAAPEGTTTVPDLVVASQSIDIAEAGRIAGVGADPVEVILPGSFTNPVVFILDTGDGAATGARVISVGSDRFTVQRTGATDTATLGYLVVEAGRWRLEDGTVIEAGLHATATTATSGFDRVDFARTYDTAPLVFAQVKGSAETHVRQTGSDAAGVALALEAAEAGAAEARPETEIGWLAIAEGTGSAAAFSWQALDLVTDDVPATVWFSADFAAAPMVLAAVTSAADPDPAEAKVLGLSSLAAVVLVAEDQSLDAETDHGSETVALLALSGSGTLSGFADTGTALSGTVWYDADGDGLRETGEVAMAGLTVWLDLDADGIVDVAEPTAVTDSLGRYAFDGLAPGRYLIAVDAPDGWGRSGPGEVSAQAAGSIVQANYTWANLTASGTVLDGLADDGWAVIDLPFLFPLFGTGYDSVTVSANGYVTFGGRGDAWQPQSLDGTTLPGPMVAVLWQDLLPGTVRVAVRASQLVVSWEDMVPYGGGALESVQLILAEDGRISFRYKDVWHPENAVAGLTDGKGNAVHLDTAMLTDQMTWRFDPADPVVQDDDVAVLGYGAAVTGQDLGLAPFAGITGTSAAGTSATLTHVQTMLGASEPGAESAMLAKAVAMVDAWDWS